MARPGRAYTSFLHMVHWPEPVMGLLTAGESAEHQLSVGPRRGHGEGASNHSLPQGTATLTFIHEFRVASISFNPHDSSMSITPLFSHAEIQGLRSSVSKSLALTYEYVLLG